jgi:hypothetical protein
MYRGRKADGSKHHVCKSGGEESGTYSFTLCSRSLSLLPVSNVLDLGGDNLRWGKQ